MNGESESIPSQQDAIFYYHHPHNQLQDGGHHYLRSMHSDPTLTMIMLALLVLLSMLSGFCVGCIFPKHRHQSPRQNGPHLFRQLPADDKDEADHV